MIIPNSPLSDEKPLIRRGRVDSVNLYEVKENELELLENGPAGTVQLNFAIFLFSMAFTCIIALATANFKWKIMETIFAITTVVGILLGTYLVLIWWRTKASITRVVLTIRNRIDDNISQIELQESPDPQPKEPKDDVTSDN